MVVVFPLNHWLKRLKIGVQIVILAVILFYILPKLLSQLWFMNQVEERIKPDYLEKPLRVINTFTRSG
ncbi:hypothetical protein HSX37_00580|uniref:hypothetical protein n=1 Tax=Dendrosporobacter quercicolus TaxID=146817 RepID=UPI000B804E43|nr:hypothetical protein [Dendrosporobacter quercicolus]NSL46549.1 hypothetical protein [Dendrosporobacter quercicolus DSM 1736]